MVARDFKITNAALGEEIVDENGRSVVKITHQPVNPRELADDSDSDDEFSDDEDLEDDEEVDMEALKAAINGKKGKKADAADEEEDDEEEDEEEDEDFEADAQTTAVLCSLIPGKIEQAQLNLVFVEDEVVMFEVTGKKYVRWRPLPSEHFLISLLAPCTSWVTTSTRRITAMVTTTTTT